MIDKKPRIALLGATGAVGREIFKIIHERSLPFIELRLFASNLSAGLTLSANGSEYTVEEVNISRFSDIDLCLASAGSKVSKLRIPQIVNEGVTVIDNCSYWRLQENVPLVVPEVNSDDLHDHSGIIGNPNCSTIQLVQVIAPLHRKFGLQKVITSTYQSVSGAGQKGIASLDSEIKSYPAKSKGFFSHPIAANLIPLIGEIEDNGFSTEEMKLLYETRKILNDETLTVTSTAVRVPVFYGHAESVLLHFKKPVTPEQVKEILSQTVNLKVLDEPEINLFPTPQDSETTDNTMVGRIRQDLLGSHWINLWIVSNNLRKGAALNAVQIAEYLINNKLI